MDIKSMTEIELKALAYDEITKLQIAQQNLAVINNELAARRQLEAQPITES